MHTSPDTMKARRSRILKFGFYGFFLVSSFSVQARRPDTAPSLIEAYEGVYRLEFPCLKNHSCPIELRNMEQFVVLQTGNPDLLGSGLGTVVSFPLFNNKPAFLFYGTRFDAASQTLRGMSNGGPGQSASFSAHYDRESGRFTGSLKTLLSLEDIHFVAIPKSVASLQSGDSVEESEIEGFYDVKWLGGSARLLMRDLGDANFAGNLTVDGTTLVVDLSQGLVNEKLGQMTFLGEESGKTIKFFLVKHGDTWLGFSVSLSHGNANPIELRKINR